MSVKTNDQLMAIYLSSLIRAITAFHDLIENKIQNRQQQEEKDMGEKEKADKEKKEREEKEKAEKEKKDADGDAKMNGVNGEAKGPEKGKGKENEKKKG
jgi:26S proteasome regulatory subunit N8